MRPDIIIESNIPFARGILEPVADVRYLSPEEITPEAMATADCLITRTRTRCDEALLAGSRCSMIASATIGLDHVDMDYCRSRGITVANAPGCNAPAVAQYVFASIIAAYGTNLHGLTLGIVGVGHVGGIVERWARGLGMTVMRCDPPRAEAEGPEGFCSLEEVAAGADIITFHVPYTKTGAHPTHHLFDDRVVDLLECRPMVFNTSRGPVTETGALLRGIECGAIGKAVIDCWEGEPAIDRKLLAEAFIATPHIAGYSLQGKKRATAMAIRAVADHFGLAVPESRLSIPAGAPETVTAAQVEASYNPRIDTARLRANPEQFEAQRNHYDLRAETCNN